MIPRPLLQGLTSEQEAPLQLDNLDANLGIGHGHLSILNVCCSLPGTRTLIAEFMTSLKREAQKVQDGIGRLREDGTVDPVVVHAALVHYRVFGAFAVRTVFYFYLLIWADGLLGPSSPSRPTHCDPTSGPPFSACNRGRSTRKRPSSRSRTKR